MIHASRPIRYWWYDHETSKQIVSAFLSQGANACLRFEPSFSDKTGEPKLDWRIVGGTASLSTDTPGGNDSHVCPPVC